MIPVMLNFDTSNGIRMAKLNFDFKQHKLFYLLNFKCSFYPQGKTHLRPFELYFQLNLLVGSDLIER